MIVNKTLKSVEEEEHRRTTVSREEQQKKTLAYTKLYQRREKSSIHSIFVPTSLSGTSLAGVKIFL